MPTKSYPAVSVRQTSNGSPIILFAASVLEIEAWSGVPQREKLGATGDETVGFQREDDPRRLRELKQFYANTKNVVQNPLLCASRRTECAVFQPFSGESGDVQNGTITIEWEDLTKLSLLELLRSLKNLLEDRLPALATTDVSESKVLQLKERVNSEHPDYVVDNGQQEGGESPEDQEGAEEEPGEEEEEQTGVEDVSSVLMSETHIVDFWQDIAARIQVLVEMGAPFMGDSFLGFPKEAVIGYLQPIVLVDGQHRLLGAIEAARDAADSPQCADEVAAAIESGKEPEVIAREIAEREARILPVSLLLDPSPAEHVFQFVVVNQKATPMGRALLGTIVSTSLSAEELASVSERLTNAGIPLQDSQAIAFLTRHPSSPFVGLVERGLSKEGDLLEWNVLGALVRIFRGLKGGKIHGEKIDYADKWRRYYLDLSPLVADVPPEEKFNAWQRQDGPWRDVFIAFWSSVRDELATTDDRDAKNYWGAPRNSNLFNKISLTILAADFFQFLCDRNYTIDSIAQVSEFVKEWLTGVKPSYFSRSWPLSGVKKDAPGTRKQWAYLWVQYRKDPEKLPSAKLFREPRP